MSHFTQSSRFEDSVLVDIDLAQDDVDFVVEETGSSRARAARMLDACDGDTVDAIVALQAIGGNQEDVKSQLSSSVMNISLSNQGGSFCRRRSSLGIPVRRMSNFGDRRFNTVPAFDQKEPRPGTSDPSIPAPSHGPTERYQSSITFQGGVQKPDSCFEPRRRRSSLGKPVERMSKLEGHAADDDIRDRMARDPLIYGDDSDKDNDLGTNQSYLPKKRRSSLGKPPRRLSQIGKRNPDEDLFEVSDSSDDATIHTNAHRKASTRQAYTVPTSSGTNAEAGRQNSIVKIRKRRYSLGLPVRRMSQIGKSPLGL